MIVMKKEPSPGALFVSGHNDPLYGRKYVLFMEQNGIYLEEFRTEKEEFALWEYQLK